MAGLISQLLGRKAPSSPFDPALEGIGGATQGTGPAGGSGFPGSTASTRTFKGASPRAVKLKSDSVTGFDQGFEGESTTQIGRKVGEGWDNPRDTPEVTTARPRTVGSLRRNSNEWFGGVPLRSDAIAPATYGAGSGLNPLSAAQAIGGHNVRDTETPATSRQPDISGGVPGSQNVRNTIALRWQNPPAGYHTYNSAPRADQNPVNDAADGGGLWASTTSVTVPNRYKWAGPGGGVQTWSVQRQMPYAPSRGDGARGADLSGTRYYAEGPPIAVNAGMGAYGVRRLRGDKTRRPVSFTEPAPWTANFYDTTASVGTPDSPGQGSQSPDLVFVSPDPGRGGINSTGRGVTGA